MAKKLWQIKFCSLRTETVYTVSVIKSESTEAEEDVVVPLLGGSQPFVTDEDDDEDFFMPVRTQSGYLTIVDTGVDRNGDPFDWREFLPSTDVDRPILVTNSAGDIVWAGFMQAQNFSGVLFERPQERKFPVQCYLSSLSRIDISPNAFGYDNLQNFAQLLIHIMGYIPNETFRNIYVQGGNDAITWLTRKFDWMVFGSNMDDTGSLVPEYTALDALTNMCTYWGWTARTSGLDLYLLSPDDDTEQDIAKIGQDELLHLAAGDTSVAIEIVHPQELQIADEFAGTDNTDAQMRGPNTASITVNVGDIDNKLLYCYPDFVSEQMYNEGFESDYTPGWREYGCDTFVGWCHYAVLKLFKLLHFSDPNRFTHSISQKLHSIIQFAEWDNMAQVTFQTKKAHLYDGGYFQLKGELYLNKKRVSREDEDYPELGTAWMWMSLGIGMTLDSCVWYNGARIGDQWSTTETRIKVCLGGNSEIMCLPYSSGSGAFTGHDNRIEIGTSKKGYIWLRFYGSDMNEEDCKLINGFDLAGFSLEYTLEDSPYRLFDSARHDSQEYTAKNDNVLADKWSTDCIFSTENYMKFGAGTVLNPDGYFAGWNYTEHREAQPEHGTGDTYPEQHLVDRVASFWSRSRRKIDCELIYNPAKVISPLTPIRVDGTKLHPLSISRDWREDVVSITAIELNDTESETETETVTE